MGGLILAAGAGTRFGFEPKLLAELDGRPLLEHAVAAQCAVTELERVVVVLGSHAEELREAVEFGRAEPVICPEWQKGMSASLRFGAATLAGADRLIVTLGDAPTVTAAVIRRFLDAPGGARATYGGRPGHPVVLGRQQLMSLAEITGDVGAREVLGAGPEIPCDDLASGRDVDTPGDLESIQGPGIHRTPHRPPGG
jgi:CTP:molybdopterin cytidylyltransferase MocA